MAPSDPADNEALSEQIQQEWRFKLKRLPERIILKYDIVVVILVLLEGMLIISNNICYLGYWEAFTHVLTQYREGVTSTQWGRAVHLDSKNLDPYSLWRGWVVPSALAGGTYVIVALISLRHELYHWKPELLADYDSHRSYVKRKIQKRSHVALEDSREFMKVLRVVGYNIFISMLAILVFWIALLQANVEATHIIELPRSYVPPIQFLVWYFMNDMFYYYPHRIAHTTPSNPLTKFLHKYFNASHKLHHRTKANLGIAAWYCSPMEQILFNIFPALIGPLFTQILSSTFSPPGDETWNTHLVTLYIWLTAASANSVFAHTGYRSAWNDPGKHDLHHERAFNPKTAVNFGTMGFFDWIHGTASSIPVADVKVWRAQRDRQAALWEASKRSGIPLTIEQKDVVKQPDHSSDWVDKNI